MNIAKGQPVNFVYSTSYPSDFSQGGLATSVNDGDDATYHYVRQAYFGDASASWTIGFEEPLPLHSVRWRVDLLSGGNLASSSAWLEYLSEQDTWTQIDFDTVVSGASKVIDRVINGPWRIKALRIRTTLHMGYPDSSKSGQTTVYELQANALVLAFTEFGTQRFIQGKDFGTVLAGEILGPVGMDFYNGTGGAVQAPKVTLRDVPADEVIELSKTADPFVPENPLVFSGSFADGAKIGSVYVRIKPPIASQGPKAFSLLADADPV